MLVQIFQWLTVIQGSDGSIGWRGGNAHRLLSPKAIVKEAISSEEVAQSR